MQRSKTTERPFVSIDKAFNRRITGAPGAIFISWLFPGELAQAFSTGSLAFFTKMPRYFIHERAWNQVKWGK